MTNQELNSLVQEELENWGEAVLLRLSAEIRKKKLVLSGELLASLQSKLLAQAAPGVNQLHLAFADSGRMKDMNKVQYKNMPPIEAIEGYIKDVGLAKFQYVPGYDKGTMPITQAKAINRIAWGIAKNKMALNNHRPKKWFSKTLYGYIDPLIDNIVTHYQQATGETLAGNFKLS